MNVYEYYAVVTNVVDGDTMDLSVDLGFHVFMNIRVRVLGIDTYEKQLSSKTDSLHKQWGQKIALQVKTLLEGKKVKIRSQKADTDLGIDAYGRWLAQIYYGDNCDLDYVKYIEEHNFNKDSEGEPIFD